MFEAMRGGRRARTVAQLMNYLGGAGRESNISHRNEDGEAAQWWKVLAFAETVRAELMRLTDGDAGFRESANAFFRLLRYPAAELRQNRHRRRRLLSVDNSIYS